MWNARGEITGELILWFGIIVAVLLASGWYFATFANARQNPASITADAFSLAAHINSGCTATAFSARYNPKNEEGTLFGKGRELCFERNNITMCKKPLCGTYDGVNIDLSKITYVTIEISNKDVIISAE